MKLLVAILLVALVASVPSSTSHLSTSLYNQQQQGDVEYGAITIKSSDNQETKVHGSVVSLNGEFKKRIGSDATVNLPYTLEAIKILIAYLYEKPKVENDFHGHSTWPWHELFAIAREFRINTLKQEIRKGLIYWLKRTQSSFKDIIPFILEHPQTVIEAFWKNLAATEDIRLFAKEVYLKRNLSHGERFLDYARSNPTLKASELFWQAFTNYSIKPGYASVREIVIDRDSVGIPISMSDDANRGSCSNQAIS